MRITFEGPKKSVEVPCSRGLNLLGHAQIEEFEIGSRCGGHGACGGDLVQILECDGKLSEITPLEKNHISSEKLAKGFRLACQAFPMNDHQKIKVKTLF